MEKLWSLELRNKLKNTPNKPGCYLFRDNDGVIIYIGKAKFLKKRLQSYFRPHSLRNSNIKNRSLIKTISDFEYIELKSDKEAIALEGKLIKSYQPYYNILWKDDKNFSNIKIDIQSTFPTISFCRKRVNDGSIYFGPYINSRTSIMAIDFIQKYFNLKTCKDKLPSKSTYKHCNDDIILNCSAPCIKKITMSDYRMKVNNAIDFLNGKNNEPFVHLNDEMIKMSNNKEYESASYVRDLIFELKKAIRDKVLIKKNPFVYKDSALKGIKELREILKLNNNPYHIECFDISNISGTNSVGSMVVAIDGLPIKNKYRKYIIKSVKGIDDPKSIAELVRRRYKKILKEKLKFPDLIMVDGGITQLRAAYNELINLNLEKIPIIGLAKKYEEIVWDIENNSKNIILNKNSDAFKVITRLRDESHRFAITFHRTLRQKKSLKSILDSINGLGEYRKNNLLKHYSSISKIKRASIESLNEVDGIGIKTAKIIYKKFNNTNG